MVLTTEAIEKMDLFILQLIPKNNENDKKTIL
jgi:hypothetical protein